MIAYDWPTSRVIGGVGTPIRYGWRAIIDIFAALNDPELDNDAKAEVMLKIFYPEWQRIPERYIGEALQKAREFIDCGNSPEPGKPKLMDWEQDASMIIPAINQVAKCEIRTNPDIHWWTFWGWYMEIGDGVFANILHIRQKRSKHKNLTAWENEFYQANKAIIEFARDDAMAIREEKDSILRWL